MSLENLDNIFTSETLKKLLPSDRADQFFEALYGEANEGAFDIALLFTGLDKDRNTLNFELKLTERPGKCLACNLTYGLPEVFSRHPVINIKGMVTEIEGILAGTARCTDWALGHTRTRARDMHTIPLTVRLA